MEVAGANRRWRLQFRCRGSRHESAVAQLFSLGDFALMTTSSAISTREITFEKSADLYRAIDAVIFPADSSAVFGFASDWHYRAFGRVAAFAERRVRRRLLAAHLHFHYAVCDMGCASLGDRPDSSRWSCATLHRSHRAREFYHHERARQLDVKWSQITAMWKFPDMIFVFWDKKTDIHHAIALPTASLGEDLSRFIEDRVREHHGRVA